ncbi:MAG TPA: substrate-binding domain-containing protein [Baekduia sp.]|uniref:sugar ABC transporter substrate-binding protein n=1 Tax=Baekduia sp. TaxID=2600305 RepID=UPI002C7FDCFF|nr:substrate-binding domain-containing protein [Baekduia sp.]HMJ35591.1 substrate-binding domain-containing protein [Baekduia sp.]
MRSRAALLAGLLTSAAALAACGSSDEGTSSGSSSGGGKGKIGVSVPTVQGPFFTAMLYGMKDEAKKLGYTLEIRDAGGYANVDKQASQFENLGVQGVKAVLIDPADPTTLTGSLAQVKAANVPVVGAGDHFPGADVSVSSSHCDVGHAMAKGAQELLPDGGTMAALTGPAGAPWTTDRWKCFTDDIKSTNIKIVSEKASDPAVEQGVTIASDFLQRTPKLDLVYGADDTVGVGAAKAVQEAKRCGKTQVLTAVLGREAEALLEEGCVNYVVAQQTVLVGRLAVREADKLIAGTKPPSDTVSVPLVPVTKDNLATVDISKLREPDSYKP